MSMEEKRNAVGKVLACLLLCSKGGCTIKKLENDYRNEEGHSIPYQEFGSISAVDFFRSIPGHVKVVHDGCQYLVYPVVTEKTQHVQDLVARQRTPRMSNRRKSSRPSRYYPNTPTPRSFVPFKVNKSVAHMLTSNPSGVSRSCVAEVLQRSRAIAGTVNADNVDDFVRGMPHTAVSSGNKIYPSRSLGARPRSSQRRYEEFDGFDVVSPRESQIRNSSEQYASALPAGSEDTGELCEPETCERESRYLSYDVRAKKTAGRRNESTGRMSSAAFIDKAAGLQYTEVARESGNREVMEVEKHVEEEEETIDPDCTYISDDDKSVEIIGSRMRERLENLIKKYPEGIWCADLLKAYSKEYKVGFDFKDYGFSSVSEFSSHLKDIFHLVRFNPRGDFKLFDASEPAPLSESMPEQRPKDDEWLDISDDEDANALPLQVESKESLGLLPTDVMAYGESVGQVRIPEVSEGPDYSNIEVYVSEVYTPSLFWIHLRKKRAKLDQFMTSLHDFYEREGDKYLIPIVVLEKGLNCVCTFQDRWHRALIKNVKPNGDVTLVFYDYGTTQSSPADSVRYLTRAFSNLPAQAIACGLYNVRPIDCDSWTRGASTEFYNKVEDLPLIAMVIKVDRVNNSMLVSLVDTQGEVDFHINDWMVQQGFAEIGSLGDGIEFEARYYEDQEQPQAADVPLVTPSSTLHDSQMLRPPPGFTKPTESTNYAAMIDDNLRNRNYNYSSTENSALFNHCNFSLNNNPLASATALYNLLHNQSLTPETLVQFCTLATTVCQILLTNGTTTTPNTTNVETPSSAVKQRTNPFESYQDRELSSTNSLSESTNFLQNLSTSEFDTSNYLNSTTLPQPSEKERNVMNGDPNLLNLDETMLREAADRDIDELSVRLHETNPFRQHIIRRDSSPVETNNNTLKAPPIPPRNPSSIKKNLNLATKRIPDVDPSPRIYYTGEPVMYKKRDEETSKFGESGQESLNNQTKVLSKTLGITPRFGEAQDFIKQEQSSSANKQNDQTHNLHGDGSKDSVEPRGHGNPFDQIETQNSEKSWRRSTVEQQPLAKTERENSRISYNAEITRDFDHLGFSTTTKPMHESPIISAQPYRSQPRYYQPMYPHHLISQQIHSFPLPMQFSQRMPLHRPNVPGYYTPPPQWVRQQVYNTAYNHATAYPSQPPLHPNFWSHNQMFAGSQAAGVSHGARPHEGQQNSKMVVNHSDSILELNGSSSHLANGGVAQNGIEERDEKVTSFVVEANEEKDLQVEESRKSGSEESMIEILNSFTENVPAVEPLKIFKAIEVNKQLIYIFHIDNQGWVSTDELVQVFLPSDTRNIVIRMLNMVNVQIDFREISRAQSPDLFAQLDDSSIRLPRMTNTKRIRGPVHLTPIQSLCQMMIALRVISNEDVERAKKRKTLPGSNYAEVVKLILAYRSDDEYWA